jgi:hypothetical protein
MVSNNYCTDYLGAETNKLVLVIRLKFSGYRRAESAYFLLFINQEMSYTREQ